MRVIVCGSRNFTNQEFLETTLDELHKKYNFTTVIHGCAAGADSMAEQWALFNKLKVDRFPAEWNKYGKKAGPIRNEKMLRIGFPEMVVGFPLKDPARKGKMTGTEHMLSIAERANVPTLSFKQSQADAHRDATLRKKSIAKGI